MILIRYFSFLIPNIFLVTYLHEGAEEELEVEARKQGT